MFYLILNSVVVDKQTEKFPVSPEMIWVEDDTDHNLGDIYDGTNIAPPPEVVISDYKQLRRNAYPYWGDQLDMIYWDKVNGTTVWVDTIADIKATYPKN